MPALQNETEQAISERSPARTGAVLEPAPKTVPRGSLFRNGVLAG